MTKFRIADAIEMRGACSMHGEINSDKIRVGNSGRKRALARRRCRWMITLKWVLGKQDGRVRIGFIWLKVGEDGGLL